MVKYIKENKLIFDEFYLNLNGKRMAEAKIQFIMSLFDLFWLVENISEKKEKNSQKKKESQIRAGRGENARLYRFFDHFGFRFKSTIPDLIKKRNTCTGLAFLPALAKQGVRLTWLFFLNLTKLLPD